MSVNSIIIFVIVSFSSTLSNLIIYVVCWIQSKAKDLELKGHTDSVDQLCWDPKHSDLVATASGDKSVRLWDARSKLYSLNGLALSLKIVIGWRLV